MKIIVIGTGILGCSLASALIERRHEVVLVGRVGAADSTSANSYGWINSHKKHPLPYHALNVAGSAYWRDVVAAALPESVAFGGHIEIAVDEGHRATLRRRLERLLGLDYPAETLDVATARDRTPVQVPDGADVGWFPGEGHASPAVYCAALISELDETQGFTRIDGTVVGIDAANTAVTCADGTVLAGDLVVVCAGAGTERLVASAGGSLPLIPAEPGTAAFGYLIDVDCPNHGIGHLVTTDRLSLRPNGPDALIVQALDLDATADGSAAPDPSVGAEVGSRLAAVLPGSDARVTGVRVGHRVIPADGLTAAGPISEDAGCSVWAVATHSGIVLGPWLGNVIAGEISGAEPEPLLAGFRPSRFTGAPLPGPLDPPRAPGDQ